MERPLKLIAPVGALILLPMGTYYGLVVAPPETYMGDVYRILYVHVPSVWMCLLAYTAAFVASLVYMFTNSDRADAMAESLVEVGLFFNILGLITGSIWAKPTWGIWWSWDPRLTTFAVLFFAYAGYIALRRFVEEPERRAVWASVANILISIGIPIVWFSVKWWNSLHQEQSSPKTMGEVMVTALRMNAVAFLCILITFVTLRYAIARARQRVELAEPPELANAAAEGS